MYRCQQRSVALALVLTWVGQVGFVFAFYCCVRTLWDPAAGGIPTLSEHFLLVPVGLVVQALPGSPGGVGVGEAGFGGLYAWFGCAAAVAVVGSLQQRVLCWAIGLGGYLVSLRLSRLPGPQERTSAGDALLAPPVRDPAPALSSSS